MIILNHDDNFIYLKASNKEAMAIGATYIKSKNAFKLPISVTAIENLSHYTSLVPVSKLYESLKQEQAKIKAIKNKTKVEPLGNLRPYQSQDVEFLRTLDSAAVFNEQRTGKTPTILSVVGDLAKVIIVCPASLKTNWEREIDTWVAPNQTIVIKGSKKKRYQLYEEFISASAQFMVIGYETLRADIAHLEDCLDQFDALVVDEAHRLRNYNSQQSKALFRLRRKALKAYPMTGTPAVNHPSDVFGIFRLINPKRFSSYWQFIERYFGYTEGRFGRELLDVREDRKKELNELLYTTSVQRKRKEVMKWIPKIQNRKIEVELTPAQYKHLKKIKEEFMAGEMEIPNVVAQITRMRQVSLEPALLDLDGKSAKTEFIKEFIQDNDGKIVIFSSFTSYLKKLHEIIPNSELLTGEQSLEQKEQAVYNVQQGNSKVLLSNIIVGGTGWTLDNVDTIIFADKSYNPIDNEQAADRIVPTDPNKAYGAKQIITLIGKDTIEQSINRLLDRKISIIKFINEYGYNALVDYKGEENNNNAGVSNT